MKIHFLGITGTWQDAADACGTTAGSSKIIPTAEWKKRILRAEHSPIRLIRVKWKWTELPYWVSVHLVRHKIGIEHFVRSQRDDRSNANIERAQRPQGALVEHECEANLQALINISRVRLCGKASRETRFAWDMVRSMMEMVNMDEVQMAMQRECTYRGFCPEMESCGALPDEKYLIKYREG